MASSSKKRKREESKQEEEIKGRKRKQKRVRDHPGDQHIRKNSMRAEQLRPSCSNEKQARTLLIEGIDLEKSCPNPIKPDQVDPKPVNPPEATFRPAKVAPTRERQPTSNGAPAIKNRDELHRQLELSPETKGKENERRSHDEHLVRLDREKETLSTSPSEGAARLRSERKNLKQEKPTIVRTRRRRGRHERRRAQKNERELLTLQKIEPPDTEAIEHPNCAPDGGKAHHSNPPLSPNEEQGAKPKACCDILAESTKKRRRQEEQPHSVRQKRWGPLMKNSTDSNRKLTAGMNMQKQPISSKAEQHQRAQNDCEDEEVESLKAKLQQSCFKEAQLQQRVDESERTLKATKRTEAELQKKHSHLSGSLSEHQSSNNRQSLRIDELGEAWDDMYGKKLRLEQSIECLRNKLQSSQAEQQALKQKVDMLQGRLESCGSERVELQQQMSGLETTTTAELKEGRRHCASMEASTQVLERQNADLCGKLISFVKLHKDGMEERSQLQTENESLAIELTCLKEDSAKLQSDLDNAVNRLQEATAKAEELSSHNICLKADSDRLTEQLWNANNDLRLMTNTHNQAIVKTEELTLLTTSLQNASEGWRKETSQFQNDLKIMTEKHDKAINNILDLHMRSGHLKAAHEAAENRAKHFHLQLSRSVMAHRGTVTKAKQLSGRILALEKERFDGQSREEDCRSQLSQQTAEHDQAVNDAKQLSGRISALEKERVDGQSREDECKSQLSQQTAKHNQAVNDVKQLSGRISALEKEYCNAQSRENECRSQVSYWGTGYNQAINHAQSLKTHNADLETRCAELQQRAEASQSALADLANQATAETETIQHANEELRELNARLEDEAGDAAKRVAALQSELAVARARSQQADVRVNVLTFDNTLLQAEVDELKARGQWEGGRDFKSFLKGEEEG